MIEKIVKKKVEAGSFILRNGYEDPFHCCQIMFESTYPFFFIYSPNIRSSYANGLRKSEIQYSYMIGKKGSDTLEFTEGFIHHSGRNIFFSGQSTNAFSPPPGAPLGLVVKRTATNFKKKILNGQPLTPSPLLVDCQFNFFFP